MSDSETEVYKIKLTQRNIQVIHDSLVETVDHNREKESLIDDFKQFLKMIQQHLIDKMAEENIDE